MIIVFSVDKITNSISRGSKIMRQRFSLPELLTAIAVTAMLAALFIPTIGRAKENSQTAVCIDNLKKIGNALNMYYSRWGVYPPDFPGQIRKELVHFPDVFHCPGDKRPGVELSYGMNAGIAGRKRSELTNIDKTILVTESATPMISKSPDAAFFRHCHALYSDGSVGIIDSVAATGNSAVNPR